MTHAGERVVTLRMRHRWLLVVGVHGRVRPLRIETTAAPVTEIPGVGVARAVIDCVELFRLHHSAF